MAENRRRIRDDSGDARGKRSRRKDTRSGAGEEPSTGRDTRGDAGQQRSTRRPPTVVGDAKRWKALSHPIRHQILAYLDEHESANSTSLAAALGESTGTTSYHLRVLADAGIIEAVPGRSSGRERWWRSVDSDHREPDYDSLSPAERKALDDWRGEQYPAELKLVERFIREHREHHGWAKASRAELYFTREGLDTFMDAYVELLYRHGHTRRDAPPEARPMQLRMFYIPKPD